MQGTKAQYIENYCIKQKRFCINFDNFGHGQSSGEFLEQTISSWLEGVEMILTIIDKPAIIVGSSMGGWLAMLAAIKWPEKILGLVCIAPAIDFTKNLIWNQLTAMQKQQIKNKGWVYFGKQGCKYPISHKLIIDAQKHLLLNQQNINIDIPVRILHGIEDEEVDYTYSVQLIKKIYSNNIVLKLVKDAGHNFSRPQDLQTISTSIEEISS
jgi:pimeloyl-ACP methyl ester carboxylesterase